MITVPLDVKCNFCVKTFCCLDCRVKHESHVHQNEINEKIRQEYLKSKCYICRGEDFPVKIDEILSSEIIQHISEKHLPLKCNNCLMIFDNINDFQKIGKCCSVKVTEKEPSLHAISEVMGDEIVEDKIKIDENHNEEALTPLTEINLRWRRKSREFIHKSDDSHIKNEESQSQLKRQTSTPMQGNFDSLSSMQFSSINCVSSSSETDLSPPVPPKPMPLVPISPKSNKKKTNSPLSKSRTKMAVQNTPLRQVMTKSIQRAIVAHGHYKHIHLQQRKMTFDSSSSSNEPTVSLMKLHIETEEEQNSSVQPLDLRLSPALRRTHVKDKNGNILTDLHTENTNRIEYEEIQVVVRRSEMENSSLADYKSCFSEPGTPKGSSSNILKKTISFEAGGRVDETPGFLLTTKSFNKIDNYEDSDVFYTPRTTPVRRVRSLDLSEAKPLTNSHKPTRNIWNFVTSVMGSLVNGSKNDNNTSKHSDNKRKWGFSLEKPFKAAANYFGKYTEHLNHDTCLEQSDETPSQKRSRANITSPIENSEKVFNSSITSPIYKRRKIQARRPIERMRNLT